MKIFGVINPEQDKQWNEASFSSSRQLFFGNQGNKPIFFQLIYSDPFSGFSIIKVERIFSQVDDTVVNMFDARSVLSWTAFETNGIRL